jgi:hypothetical protein
MLLLLSSKLIIAEDDCFPGIDDVCDPNCIDVDFDCVDNPHQEGLFYEKIRDQNNSLSLNDTGNKSKTLDLQNKIILTNKLEGDFIETKSISSLSDQIVIYGSITILLLSITLYFLFRRIKLLKREKELRESTLLNYILKLRSQHYSDEAIKSAFIKQGYPPQYVDKLLNTI